MDASSDSPQALNLLLRQLEWVIYFPTVDVRGKLAQKDNSDRAKQSVNSPPYHLHLLPFFPSTVTL